MASLRIHLQSAATAKSELRMQPAARGMRDSCPMLNVWRSMSPYSMRPATSRSQEDLHRPTWSPDRHAVAQFPTGMAGIAHHPAPATCIPVCGGKPTVPDGAAVQRRWHKCNILWAALTQPDISPLVTR
jgi:hypothetical protein